MTDTDTNDFLLEIGTEELPPKVLRSLSEALAENLKKCLVQAALNYGDVKLFATPRRLAVLIENLEAKQQDKFLEQRGPNVNVAFTANGQPTAACLGFATANGIAVEDLERVTDKRGTFIVAKKHKMGEKTVDLLPAIVTNALKNLPIPRLMRWGTRATAFIRPVHWVVMVYGNSVVPGEILGITAGNKTYGHRFHHPESLTIDEPKQYETLLQQQGFVIADWEKRQQLIISKTKEAIAGLGRVLFDASVLDEVTSLVEWPIALVGHFDERFLILPPEVLVLVLQKQQRCFPVVDDKEKLVACFVAISNIESKQPDCVVTGNESVILARLTDAEFFYRNDSQYLLESYFDKLEKTVFQTGLGNLHQKTLRLAELTSYIASIINADVAASRRAAELAKSDLMTTMVGEFPELQGVIGYYYALREGLVETIANPLREQYLPAFAKDKVPDSLEGCALAIADRIDTIVGVFSLGKAPTGERDPFALRRAAFGILRIILEKKLNLDVLDLIRRSLRKYLEQVDKFDEMLIKNYEVSSKEQEKPLEEIALILVNKIVDFIFERQRSWYLEDGGSNSVFDAVRMLERPITYPLDFAKRLHAVRYFQTLEAAQVLSAAHKRVKNILASVEKLPETLQVNQKLLQEAGEIELATKVLQMQDTVMQYCAKAQYQEALQELATLKSSVDYFFNTVMVMVDNEKLRNNRLALLKQLQDLLCSVADIAYVL